jgi:hypothetical protein
MKISGKKAIKIPGQNSGRKKVDQIMKPLKQNKSLVTHRASRGR